MCGGERHNRLPGTLTIPVGRPVLRENNLVIWGTRVEGRACRLTCSLSQSYQGFLQVSAWKDQPAPQLLRGLLGSLTHSQSLPPLTQDSPGSRSPFSSCFSLLRPPVLFRFLHPPTLPRADNRCFLSMKLLMERPGQSTHSSQPAGPWVLK